MISKWGRLTVSISMVLLLTFIIAALQHHRSSQPQNEQTNRSSSQPFERRSPRDLFKVAPIARQLYPYSVIPGGLNSTEDLRSAVKNDPVVALHYEGFELATTRIAALQRPMSGYVSYRIGEEVFWTRHKVNLPKGETVVSDGARLARTRCGNRFSEIPQLPTSAKEPSSEILEAALEPAFVNLPEEAITFPQSFDHPLRAPEFADTSVTPSVPPIWWVPIIPIGPLTPLPPGPPPVTPPENPPVNIPEAGTGTLLIFGMLLVGIARGWRWWPKRS